MSCHDVDEPAGTIKATNDTVYLSPRASSVVCYSAGAWPALTMATHDADLQHPG